MKLRATLNSLLTRHKEHGSIEEFAFDNNQDVKSDIQSKYNFYGDLLELFTQNKKQVVHKWHHYIPIYDRYFSKFRKKKTKFLEIGVSDGGSLQMWRKYFGEEAIIYGIDNDQKCAALDGNASNVRIGPQEDKKFLDSVIHEMGGVDIILDDGSHKMEHIKTSLFYLFPQLSNEGIYMIEDLHTAYWKNFGGGYKAKNNFFNLVLELVDDMHRWYHKNNPKHIHISSICSSIHIYDSIVILEKARTYKPTHSRLS